MTASLASAFEGPTIQTPIRSNLYFSRLYFPQTTTSGPSVVSELIPHETLSFREASTLRLQPHDRTRMTRGRCSSLRLHRDGLAPSTFRRSPGAPIHTCLL